jgi:alpha-amylase
MIYGVEGIPYVYYGQEQGYNGGADPANREALWLSGYDTQKDMYTFITTMNTVRSAAMNASSSFNTNAASIIGQDDNNLVIRKDPIISIVTNRGSKASTAGMAITNTGFNTPTELIDVVSCATYTTDNKGGQSVRYRHGGCQPKRQRYISWLPGSRAICVVGCVLAARRRLVPLLVAPGT